MPPMVERLMLKTLRFQLKVTTLQLSQLIEVVEQ